MLITFLFLTEFVYGCAMQMQMLVHIFTRASFAMFLPNFFHITETYNIPGVANPSPPFIHGSPIGLILIWILSPLSLISLEEMKVTFGKSKSEAKKMADFDMITMKYCKFALKLYLKRILKKSTVNRRSGVPYNVVFRLISTSKVDMQFGDGKIIRIRKTTEEEHTTVQHWIISVRTMNNNL